VSVALGQPSQQPATMHHPTRNIPRHVAVIMDGNGRWACQRGLPRIEGHRAGIDTVREIVRTAGEAGIEYLTLYAFSIENWNRPDSEVRALMDLLEIYLQSEQEELDRKNVRLRAIGQLDKLPESTRRQLDASMTALDKNTGMTLILALSYGGRAEIVDAAQALAREVRDGTLKPEEIDDQAISQHLYTREFPDPDLLIRTSGEMRVSNFLLWQISYAEIYVTETLWPDFRKEQFFAALEDYGKRHRRFGRVQNADDN
jgi:undecaprenyl diphosphate synthase